MARTTDAKAATAPRWAAEVAQLWPPQGEWTEADYFALPDTNRFVELSEGELIMPPHPTHTHQLIVLELATVMRAFVQQKDLGTVQIAPLPVRLWPGKIREPDILFVAREHADRIGEQVYGPPDLVVEVLSPATQRTDRQEKATEYARAGVREYWIVDPEARTIEVLVLQEGRYRLLGKWNEGETARSELLEGFEVAVREILASG
ncbi:MAG TPA: Uma2 family endonuclease [Anaerolineae bacterium]|nr:Uma2 family endonuclease [Anaerolineae bacterium]